ncbi:MAG: hypothetical protein E3K36_04500 [Candidatus Brocadia sp.]|nr:hypothetical protein [Candidatus Brocadia sp.]
MKQKLKTVIILAMAVFISLIAIYAFKRVSTTIEQARGAELLWKCFAIWIKSIILTQTVLVLGGLFLFMLRKPKGTV